MKNFILSIPSRIAKTALFNASKLLGKQPEPEQVRAIAEAHKDATRAGRRVGKTELTASVNQPTLDSKDLATALYKTYVNRSTRRALSKQARRKALHPNAPRSSQNFRPGPGMAVVLKDYLSRCALAHGYTL